MAVFLKTANFLVYGKIKNKRYKMRLGKPIHFSFFLLLTLLLNTNNTNAQFTAYHGIVFPYANANNVVMSAGDITYASLGYSANIQSNPAFLSYFKSPVISVYFTEDISKYYISEIRVIPGTIEKKGKSKTLPAEYKFYPASSSAILPINLWNKKFVIGTSINKFLYPEQEVWLENPDYSDVNFRHQRNGDVWKANIGFGCSLPFGIHAGIGWSKWFGRWKWLDKNPNHDITGSGELLYDGSNFYVGFAKQFTKILLSFTYYTPITLMRANDALISWHNLDLRYDLKQHYNGAFKLGVGYKIYNRMTLSSGYRYQKMFLMNMKRKMEEHDNYEIDAKYGDSHQIAIACEYFFYSKQKKIPIFFSYWANWQPRLKLIDLGYQFMTSSNDFYSADHHSVFNNNLAFGIQYPIAFFTINITGQWQLNSIRIVHNLVPSIGNIRSPRKEFYLAKRSTFLFNVGLSYSFK